MNNHVYESKWYTKHNSKTIQSLSVRQLRTRVNTYNTYLREPGKSLDAVRRMARVMTRDECSCPW